MRFKTMGIAVAMLFSLCFVINIQAASITSMSIYAGEDWGRGTPASVSLTADEGISSIDWYIDDTYRFSSSHNGENTVHVSLGTFYGHINGGFIDENRDTKDPDTDFQPGETYRVSPDSMKLEFPHGGPMQEDEARYFNAHTHLQVTGRIAGKTRRDDWEADTRQQTGTTAVKFTYKDNPE